MAQINLEEVYTELSSLLKDICSFLNTEVQNGTLSATTKTQAEKLLCRSKEQVEVISKISQLQESTNSNYPYLQMQGPTIVQEPLSEYVDAEKVNYYESNAEMQATADEEEEENYAEVGVEEINLPSLNSIIMEEMCPYTELPLCVTSEKAIKYGPLIRKETYFILEKKKQLLVGLVGYWLLIYFANKKEIKPSQIIYVKDYRARAVEQKKDPIFEIVSNNKKTYEFIAKSEKDMHQWIVAINCKKQQIPNENVRYLPKLPVNPNNLINDISNNLEKISNHNISISDDDEQGVYESLEDIKKIERVSEYTPKLPARQIKHFGPRLNKPMNTINNTYNNVPFATNRDDKELKNREEEEKMENTYDPVQNGDVEEEEEDIYDEPKLLKTINENVLSFTKTVPLNDELKTKNENQSEDEDEDCDYDIPRIENISQQQNNIEEETEDEYDELRIVPQTNILNLHIEKPSEKVSKLTKPLITSPKPRLQDRFERFSPFSKKTDNSDSQEGNNTNSNNKKIQNIIQQMEASLNFKIKN